MKSGYRMQLVFTIHVIITLLMLKPSASNTCDNATKVGFGDFACQQTSMDLKDLQIPGRCCEAVDPSYANQPTTCLAAHRRLVTR